MWETFVFREIRHRERRAGRAKSLYFWGDRTREVDFLVDTGDGVEIFESKWTELADESDTANLVFVREALGGPARVAPQSCAARVTAIR